MLKYQLKKIQYGTGIMQINEMILRTLFVFEPGCVYYDQATEGIKRPEQPDFIDPSDPQVYHNEITWPEPLPTDVLVKLNELMVKLQLGLESKKGALKDLGEQFPDEKLQELWLEQIDDLNMDAAKRIKTAQIDAAIIALDGHRARGRRRARRRRGDHRDRDPQARRHQDHPDEADHAGRVRPDGAEPAGPGGTSAASWLSRHADGQEPGQPGIGTKLPQRG